MSLYEEFKKLVEKFGFEESKKRTLLMMGQAMPEEALVKMIEKLRTGRRQMATVNLMALDKQKEDNKETFSKLKNLRKKLS